MHRALYHGLSRNSGRELVFQDGITGTGAATLASDTSTASGTHANGTSATTLDSLISTASGTASDAALDFNFLTDTIIAAGGPAVITFTRASTATYFNSSGVLSLAAIDAPRLGHDPISPFASRGLLVEEGRTNLLVRSADLSTTWVTASATVTTDQVVAPDGTTSGDLVTELAASATHGVTQTLTVASNVSYALSVFAKAGTRTWMRLALTDNGANNCAVWFNLSGSGTVGSAINTGTATLAAGTIQALSNGWYRCTMTGICSSANSGTVLALLRLASADNISTYLGDGSTMYFWGAQCEAGGFGTTYIPTAGSTVGRSVDSAVVGTLSPWFNATEGTIYCEIVPIGIGTLQTYAYFDDNTSNERMGIRSSAGSNAMLVVDGNVQQVNSALGSLAVGTAYKCAMGYKLNDFGGSQNGGAIVTDTGGTVPTVTRFIIGARLSAGEAGNCYFRRVKVYNTRKTNSEIVAMTV